MRLQLNDNDVNLILTGLGKLPAEQSFNLLGRLLKEVEEEQQRRKTPLAPPLPDIPQVNAGLNDED